MAITVSSGPQVGPDQAARRELERRLGVADLFYSENRIQALGENSFEVLALAPLFQAYAEEYRIFLHGFPNSSLGQGHWNIAGHHLAGQLIAQELCKKLAGAAGPGHSGVSRNSIGQDSIETSDINGSTIHALTTLLLDGYTCGSN